MIVKNVNKSKLNRKEYALKMHVFLWKSGIVRVDTESLGESEDTQTYCIEAKRLARVSKLHRKNAFGLENINHP